VFAVLAAIRESGEDADQRLTVVSRLLQLRRRGTVLGGYSLTPEGDSTLRGYAPYAAARGLPRTG
jgi:hypothetical protein